MERTTLRALARPAGLAATGATLCCWSLPLVGSWPAVGALPAPLRRVLVLHYLDGLSYAEIAAALDVPVSTVKGRLFRSRARLRGALDPEGTAAPRPRRRKETATMTAIPTPQEPAGARLVPVTVESIRVGGDPPAAENVRPYLERLLAP
jgi:hypothetical protein